MSSTSAPILLAPCGAGLNCFSTAVAMSMSSRSCAAATSASAGAPMSVLNLGTELARTNVAKAERRYYVGGQPE